MSKRKSHLYHIYAKPLPISLSKLTIWNVIFGFDIVQADLSVVYEDGVFKALDQFCADQLWYNGFFGKGSLSRSQPSFAQRSRRRLMLDVDANNLTLEEITKLRRQERLDFKNERLRLETLENKYKVENDHAKMAEIEVLKTELTKTQKTKKSINELFDQYYQPSASREEDKPLLNNPLVLNTMEYLQLLPCEVLFLSLINLIKVYADGELLTFSQLVKIVIPNMTLNSSFLHNYIVYHHYRSLGWCVKSGVKFSTDFILYEKGPVFNHANFAILIADQDMDWIKINSIMRVVGTAKKKLVLNFVNSNNNLQALVEHFLKLENLDESAVRKNFAELLKQFSVSQTGLNRWSGSRNRE